MKYPRALSTTIVCATLSFGTASQADLIGVLPGTQGGTDYQAYYDSEADLTWLANANVMAATNWQDANAWAAGLDVGGVTGWRLPATPQPDASCSASANGTDYGSNCTGSEMGNLFYNVLGGVAGESIVTTHNNNYDLFLNIQPDKYWSATLYPVTAGAWYFDFSTGEQWASSKSFNTFYAWAVFSGNAGEAAVPLPAAGAMFCFGLFALGGVAARKRQRRLL